MLGARGSVGARAAGGRAARERAAVACFTAVGLGLLVAVATIAVLSSPFPFRRFTDDPAVLLIFHAPYGWILPMCVAPALGAHVLALRWLWSTRAGGRVGASG